MANRTTVSGNLGLRFPPQKHDAIYGLLREGKYHIALIKLNELRNETPDDLEIMQLLFDTHFELRNWSEALAIIEWLIIKKPEKDQYKRQKAKTLSNAGRYQEAINLGKSLLRNDTDIEMLDLLKVGHFNLKQYELAFEYGQRALSSKDRHACANNNGKLQLKRRQGNKKVISFSLWGSDTSYQCGAMINALLIKYIYPGWKARFYVGDGVAEKTTEFLAKTDAEIIVATDHFPNIPASCWRFLVIDDPSVSHFLCRDCDSRLSPYESYLVCEWQESGLNFHVIRDHLLHNDLILAGIWGGTAIADFDLENKIYAYLNNRPSNKYGQDQKFLGSEIWPLIRQETLIHDRNYKIFGTHCQIIKHQQRDHIGACFQNRKNVAKEIDMFDIPKL